MDPWPEVRVAREEGRRELVLRGDGRDEPPEEAFSLEQLSLLSVSASKLRRVPSCVGRLRHLRELLLFNDELESLDPAVGLLRELRVLDVSRNRLTSIPAEVGRLPVLAALNVSGNRLVELPTLVLPQLRELDASQNRLTVFPDACRSEHERLADVRLAGNKIVEIPAALGKLPALKNLDLSENLIAVVPQELADAPKLKELNLKSNPISDNRLQKLIDQCGSKQIVNYVRQSCPKAGDADAPQSKKSGKKSGGKSKGAEKREPRREENEDADALCDRMRVLRCDDALPNVRIEDSVKAVRPHIVCCLVRGLAFNEDTFKRFIQVQTKLHDGLCERRNAATIATHDFDKIPQGDLVYVARPPHSLKIRPLNRVNKCSGLELYGQLRKEADELRKEKKRNVYSGIHKYLYLLEGKSLYPSVEDSAGNVISFPPITNSEDTKMSRETKNMLVEVTSSTNQTVCRKVLDVLLLETMSMGVGGRADGEGEGEEAPRLGVPRKLDVQQMKIVDGEGKMRVVYPSKVDLHYEDRPTLKIIRE